MSSSSTSSRRRKGVPRPVSKGLQRALASRPGGAVLNVVLRLVPEAAVPPLFRLMGRLTAPPRRPGRPA